MEQHLNKPVGLQDKIDAHFGLGATSVEKRITSRDHLIFVDTRDCVGEDSLTDAQQVFLDRGGRAAIYANIITMTGEGVSPINVTANLDGTTGALKNGDRIFIQGVNGNTNANGYWGITAVTATVPVTFSLVGSLGNKNYAGGGLVTREADEGYPTTKQTTSFITGNEMIVQLTKKLKVIRSFSLINAIIPRDIIPIGVYLSDFLPLVTTFQNQLPGSASTRVATTGPIVLSTLLIIDGIQLVTGDRILVKNQAAPIDNGIYVADVGAWSRSSDLPLTYSASGFFMSVSEGTVNGGLSFICTNSTFDVVGADPLTFGNYTPMSWTTYIPQEKDCTESKLFGFFTTPLEIFRSYFNGSFSPPNQVTPPPLKLWNPPVGSWPLQPKSYPHQTVPTYRAENNLILGGYGIYDLNDFTLRGTSDSILNRTITNIARKLLLFLITPIQSFGGIDYLDLILSSNVITMGATETTFFGYGNFQRFIPGPGIQLNYQPGTSDGADPTVSDPLWPIPFPNFKGNVWGPYDSPGDRFQKVGLMDTIQDLYLNGDLQNLLGNAIIKPWVKPQQIPYDSTFGLVFTSLIPVNLRNISEATNPNIRNAMRIISNGFGALDITAEGDGNTTTEIFLNAGGQGPDVNGIPGLGFQSPGTGGAWVDNQVISGATPGTFSDPTAVGSSYAGPDLIPQISNTSTPGDSDPTTLNRRIGSFDSGPNNGDFVNQVIKYIRYTVNELPETNVVMQIFQVQRDNRVQSLNADATDAMFSIPIRLNVGSTTGTRKYVENIQAFLADLRSVYWEKRFLSPLQSLYKLSIRFTTYDGTPIPLERQLDPRRSIGLFRDLQKLLGDAEIPNSLLFDPLDPRLLGRETRNISLVFRANNYEYESPGLYFSMVRDMLESEGDNNYTEDTEPFAVRASNFGNYAPLFG